MVDALCAHAADNRPPKRRRALGDNTRRTLEWWIQHRNDPLYPGASLSVLGLCYTLCDIKTSNAMRNEAFNIMCRFYSECCLPTSNLHPPSYYVVRAILACETASSFEHHMCCHCDQVFDDLPREEWSAHASDECPRCGASRFNVLNGRCTPRKRFWDLGVSNLIKQWMADPEFAKHVGRDSNGKLHCMDDPATLLGSAYGRMLDDVCKNPFSHGVTCACFELGAALAP